MTDSQALQTIASRFALYMAGAGFAGANHEVTRAALRLDEAVATIIARGDWDPSSPEHGNTEGKTMHMLDLEIGVSGFYLLAPLELARAYRCPQSRFHGSAEILQRIAASLAYFETFVSPHLERQGTWYGWDIAIPRWLSHTLVLCGEELPPQLLAKLHAALCATPFQLFKIFPDLGLRRSDGGPVNGGANTMEVALHLLLRAVTTGDRQWADIAAAQIPIAMAMNPEGEGIQPDWSFHFHGKGVNTAYGHICLASQAMWIYLTKGTPWECPAEYLDLHLGTLREFFTLNAWRGRFAPYTLDRTIARPRGIYGETLGEFYLTSLLLTLGSEVPGATALAPATAEWLRGREAEVRAGVRPELDLGQSVLHGRLPLPPVGPTASVTRYYPNSEYLLVRRPNWFAAVLMNSTRTASWKGISGEHVHGSSGAEFSVALTTDGSEYTHSTVPTMDWSRLIGVTRCDTLEASPEGYGQSTFVGALTVEDFAVLGMQYLLSPPAQDTLRANKSLFVAGDALVLLGTAVRCDADDPVTTTLFHAPVMESGVYRRGHTELDAKTDGTVRLEAGETLFLRNVAIRLLTTAQLTFSTRRGSYAGMNAPGLTPLADMIDDQNEDHVHRWAYLTVDHGARPKDGTYGAVIWPGVETDFDSEAAFAALTILRETEHHKVTTEGGLIGGEVRFPGDWRIARGLSYPAAEPAQWGSIAQWQPMADSDKLRLQLLPPLRYDRLPNRATEIFLPEGMEDDNGPPITLGGQPWPKNVVPIMADGKTKTLEVNRQTT